MTVDRRGLKPHFQTKTPTSKAAYFEASVS